MAPLIRLTLFKIPDEAVVHQAVERYNALSETAVKVSKQCVRVQPLATATIPLTLYLNNANTNPYT